MEYITSEIRVFSSSQHSVLHADVQKGIFAPYGLIPMLASFRGLLTCSICGKNLTGSTSKGNGEDYEYYHCQPGCKERHAAVVAHKSFSEEWLESLSIKPEMATLYLSVMEHLQDQEGDRKNEIKRLEDEVN